MLWLYIWFFFSVPQVAKKDVDSQMPGNQEEKNNDQEVTIYVMAAIICLLVAIIVGIIIKNCRSQNTYYVSDVEMQAFSTFE